MSHTSTHTYAKLEVSKAAYDEIRALLLQADYGHLIHSYRTLDEVIDMSGIALMSKPLPPCGIPSHPDDCECSVVNVVEQNGSQLS